MTIAQIEEKHDLIRTLKWLERIRGDYAKAIERIDKEGEHFTITGIGFESHNEGEVIHINPHRTINPRYIRNALSLAVKGLNEEIKQLKKEIER